MNQVRLAGNVTVPPAVCPLPRAVSPGCCISDAASAAIAGSTISVFASFAIEDSDGFRSESMGPTPSGGQNFRSNDTTNLGSVSGADATLRPIPRRATRVRPLTAKKTGVRVP